MQAAGRPEWSELRDGTPSRPMGFWDNTTYVNCSDARRVLAAVERLVGAEQMCRVERPSARVPERFDPMQYGKSAEHVLWGVYVIPGRGGWSALKTAPLELLCEQAHLASEPRLVSLAGELAAPAFSFNVYDGTECIFLETDGCGSLAVSGFSSRHPHFHPPVDELQPSDLDVRIRLPQIGAIADQCKWPGEDWLDHEAFARRLAAELLGDMAGFADNLTSVDNLVRHVPLPDPRALDAYFRRADVAATSTKEERPGWPGPVATRRRPG